MKALVLEKVRELNLREIEIDEKLGPRDVRVEMRAVGICGSDVHYYSDGHVGPFYVEEPLVLGHEGAGVVVETGAQVDEFAPGDRVCMEPGIPNLESRETRLGIYHLDPSVTFWATPPVHGCLRTSVVHPAAFTYKLPENVSLAEGAMVEPLAVGLHAANKARIRPGDVAAVTGAGTIGLCTAAAALAGGCSRVVISDLVKPKLALARSLGPVRAVNVAEEDLAEVTMEETGGRGTDVVFEASGSAKAAGSVLGPVRRGGRIVFVGMPNEEVAFDIVALQAKEVEIETVFRYANVYDRAVDLLASGRLDVRPFITDTYPFEKSVQAFEFASDPPDTTVKVQIEFEGE